MLLFVVIGLFYAAVLRERNARHALAFHGRLNVTSKLCGIFSQYIRGLFFEHVIRVGVGEEVWFSRYVNCCGATRIHDKEKTRDSS